MKKLLSFCLLFLLKMAFCEAQDLGGFKSKKPFELSGSVSASIQTYAGDRPRNGQEPFFWHLSGSPTVSIYGVRLPFSVAFSNGQTAYNVPSMRRLGCSPYWKWVKIHAGYRNLQLSPYTLSGFTFLGGGVELTPGILRFTALRGRFDDRWRQPLDPLIETGASIQLFKRTGWAVKIGLGKPKNFFDLIFMKTRDDAASGQFDSLSRLNITPAANAVAGSHFRFTFFKIWTVEANGAASAITHNLNGTEFPLDSAAAGLLKRAERILPINISSRYFFAADAETRLDFRPFSVGVKWQRIDPFYSTHGLYFLQNDVENRTATVSIRLFRGKVNGSFSLGEQRNNLKNYQGTTQKRRIGSANLNWAATKKLNLSTSISNFSTDQQAGFVEVNDTFRLAFVGTTMSFSPRYSWKKNSQTTQSISLTTSLNRFRDLNQFRADAAESQTRSANLSYNFKQKEGWGLRAGLLWSASDFRDRKITRTGANAGLSRMLKKKFSLGLNETFSLAELNEKADGFVLNSAFSFGWKIREKQSLNLNLGFLARRTKVQTPFNELRAGVQHSWSF